VQLENGEIELSDNLGSNISNHEELKEEILSHIAKASRAWSPQEAHISEQDLSIATNHSLHRRVLLSVLLYEAET
jgi:hypothetical protein